MAAIASTHRSKWQLFLLILLALIIMGTLLSIAARQVFVAQDASDYHHIALLAPLSGPDQAFGEELVRGAELAAEAMNAQGHSGGAPIRIVATDIGPDGETDGDITAAVEGAIADPQTVALLGPWSQSPQPAAFDILDQAGLVGLTSVPLQPETSVKNSAWHMALTIPGEEEARFLANYSRNVQENIFLSIISQTDSPRETLIEPFKAVYERFGTPVRGEWTLNPASASIDARIADLVAAIDAKADAGALLLALEPGLGARVLTAIRKAGLRNPVVAPSTYATHAFTDALVAHAGDPLLAADYADGVLVSSPLLLDIATQAAQTVRNNYQERFGRTPDWISAYGYETTNLIAFALDEAQNQEGTASREVLRTGIREALIKHNTRENALQSLSGPLVFNQDGLAKQPVRIGVYSGLDLVAALTQLQPIERRGSIDYIDELREGRLLYVNDRFMYRTNVVYTGVTLHSIEALDVAAGTATLDLSIWFRYRGSFSPETVSFLNAVEPVVLDTPIAQDSSDDLTYSLYRVTAPFIMDFSAIVPAYGQRVAGVSLRHADLDRNNLLYVGDVLGMGLDAGSSFAERLRAERILAPGVDWRIENAWFSQEMFQDSTFGKPTYVGYGASDPLYSRIELGLVLDSGTFDLINLLPNEYYLYILVFSILGSIFAIAMDHRKWGRYWFVQSFGLRMVFWPPLLLALGALMMDVSSGRLEAEHMDVFVLIYLSLWWLMPARLAAVALERFLWWPIEARTGRAIPNLIRLFAQFVLYTFAIFGIIAFVFDQKLTSLLATGGLLTMIVGLAIQANISNVFSGIFLNVERPFSIGDWIKIGDADEGVVTDMTWRTTRVRTRAGYIFSIPNGQVSDALICNYSSSGKVRIEIEFQLSPDADPKVVAPLIEAALPDIEDVETDPEPNVRFIGLGFDYDWLATYEVQFWISDYDLLEDVKEAVITHVLASLSQADVAPWRAGASAPARLRPARGRQDALAIHGGDVDGQQDQPQSNPLLSAPAGR